MHRLTTAPSNPRTERTNMATKKTETTISRRTKVIGVYIRTGHTPMGNPQLFPNAIQVGDLKVEKSEYHRLKRELPAIVR